MAKYLDFWRDERGSTAIEYSLIASLIFLSIVGAVVGLGQGVMDVLYNKIGGVLG
ncbi:MAG: Flp family type IVb pilin [Bdellovibrionales bacterium]